jgi:excisionase family DNA binding protein
VRARHKKTETMAVTEAAAELRVSESTVWRLLRAGELTSVVESGRRRVLRSAIERRIRQRSAGALKPLSSTHPLWKWVGAARSGGQGPGSEDKYGVLTGE